MTAYLSHLKILAKRLLLVVLLFQLCRLLFLLFNLQKFTNPDLMLFLGGLRFDISAIIYLNFLIIIGHSLPGNFKMHPTYRKTLKVLFFSINALALFTNFIDFEYYKFTGRRSSINLITATGMQKELPKLLLSYAVQYWYIPVLLIVVLFGFWKIIPSLKNTQKTTQRNPKNTGYQTGIFIAILGISFLFARGGWQPRPLKQVDAIAYSDPVHTALVLNTPFCIFKTLFKKEDLIPYSYYTEPALKNIFDPVKQFHSVDSLPSTKKNVVIIILESFGNESVGASNIEGLGYTPFLDSLLKKSLFFKHSFANGRRSIDAVPSIVSGVPSLMEKTFTASRYAFNDIKGLPKILKEKGYFSAFLHGADNGSQNFDKYARIAGFDTYIGKNEYPYPDNYDGRWGIFDEAFLQFSTEQFNAFPQPFFATLFTLSSHPPYTIPKQHKEKFPKGTLRIHESVGYADYALRKFFETAKKQSWYTNTLFVFSADHCSSEGQGLYQTTLGKFMIPIAFYDPSNEKLAKVSTQNFQQIDILPSILEYLNYNGSFVTFGNEISKPDRLIAFYLNRFYYFIYNDYCLVYDGSKTISLYNWKKDPMQTNDLKETMAEERLAIEAKAKAYIQSFNNRMINNKLTVKNN